MGEVADSTVRPLSIDSEAPGQRKVAIAALLVVTSVWGATFIWMKQALNALQPEIEMYGSNRVVGVLVAARFAIAAIVMFVFFSKARKALWEPEQWKGGAILGGLMLIGFVTQMIGLDEINPAVSAFLTSLYVVFTATITIFMTRKRPSRVLLFGVVLATFGAGFIQGPPHLTWGFGEALTVVCAVFFALHIIYTQKITQEMDPIGVTQTSFAVVAIGAVAMTLLLGGGQTVGEWSFVIDDGVLIPVLCLGIGGSFFCLLLLNMFQRYLHPIQAAIIYAFEPVWATMYGLGLDLVDWSAWIFVGGGALFLGNIVVELFTHGDEEE